MSETDDEDSAAKTRVELVTQAPMVNWLRPSELVRTGIRVLIASTFGSFADARLVQAALHRPGPTSPIDFSQRKSLWMDFVADTGDGWDSTYSVAYSISRDSLRVGELELPRAELLVLGGDQVYPTPVDAAYRTRFQDPFRSAFPSDIPPTNPDSDPKLVAIPGNHDWYDGLHGFLQLFCSGLYIGRWKTLQQASYYAVKLPYGWWLWGVDLQLDSGIDAEQRRYFGMLAATQLAEGERVVIVSPEPSWIDESERLRRQRQGTLAQIETQAPRFRDLKYIETLVHKSSARLAAVLAGDLHHYAHYLKAPSSDEAPERITCGGGGAYLFGTHDLPQDIRFGSEMGDEQYRLGVVFPDVATSRSLRNKAWLLPWRNTVFCSLLAGIYMLYAWVLQSASKVPHPALENVSMMQYLSRLPLTWRSVLHDLPAAWLQVLAHSPSSVVLTLSVLAACAAFTARSAQEKRRRAWLGGAIHGALHLALALALLWGVSLLNLNVFARLLGTTGDAFLDHPVQVLLGIGEIAILGGSVGGLLFGVWLVVTNAWFRWHRDEVFSSQGIADYKSFLRMKLDEAGLTIYPLKITKVARKWTVGQGITTLRRMGRTWRLLATRGSGARFEPATPIAVELIEKPILIAP